MVRRGGGQKKRERERQIGRVRETHATVSERDNRRDTGEKFALKIQAEVHTRAARVRVYGNKSEKIINK